MKKFPYPLLALLFALTLTVQAKDASTTAPYFDPATLDFKAVLSGPPAVGSPEALQEIDLILQKQAACTPEELARIKQEQNLSFNLFQNVLGSWFEMKNLPLTAKLLRNVDANQHTITDAAKNYWHRPRLPLQDPRIHPLIGLPGNGSYPSGHSMFGTMNALVLAELAPDLKDAILARGKQIGDDRVTAGVHFPSDVEASRTLAHAVFVKLMASPAFQDDLAQAKTEIATARQNSSAD